MEKKEDVQLIYDILSGNDDAFSTLVQKYQKSVHALAWRKIRDFHYAEEITQDTFLQAYQKLSTLKNPHQFAGWLYVIANRLCINWLQRNKSAMQSLEGTSVREVDKLTYERYVSEARESEATERRYEIVEKLLEKLPESERTVMTLYYLGKMTAKEIGNFLGVSVNTIKSRLRRARERLQEDQERLIQEVFSGVQISTGLSQNIMRRVADLKPTSPSAAKPLIPWMALGTAAVLVLLLLGASDRYLTRFQKPYSFDAASEPTIEIVDAPVILDSQSKPDLRNRAGRTVSSSRSNSVGLQASQTTLASTTATDAIAKFSTSPWTQTSGPPAGYIRNIFAAPEGIVYAVASSGLYRLTENATAWTHINRSVPIDESLMPMAAHGGNLYIVSTDEIFTSADRGETWGTLGLRPKGEAVGILIMDEVQPRITIYLALRDEGVFRSTDYKTNRFGLHRTTDGGNSWYPFMNGMTGTLIIDLVAFNNRLYAHTGYEVYQSSNAAEAWKKVPVDGDEASVLNPRIKVASESKLVVIDNMLYLLSSEAEDFQIFHLSTDGDTLIPVQGVPIFDRETVNPHAISRLQTETATASHDAFYVEYQRGLFKWKLGDPEWINTGLVDTSQVSYSDFRGGFKIAVSDETVYVGQRDGHLFQSLDEGNSWKDITSSLPLRFTRFKEVTFIGSTIYVATNKGTLVSHTGEHWSVLTDRTGVRPIVDRFATDGTKVYGIGDAGVYRLDTDGQWKQISSNVPDKILSLVVGKERLYIATQQRGMFHIPLASNSVAERSSGY